MLTPTASEMIDSLADRTGLTRSEFVERSIQWLDEHWDEKLQREIGEKDA